MPDFSYFKHTIAELWEALNTKYPLALGAADCSNPDKDVDHCELAHAVDVHGGIE